ncbi:hypothetical protein HQ29_07105 [Porphyromonas canoris]|uniref:hypothetical protein n=1 Tax=Porphyromonas canoris TaxID=36875 RepID=UPI00051D77D2|nr:hypothetical protein [Porphyromonas canoris]KGL51743.1 hypothetical protein HQ29_07105 [Porphyromonas canoris]
MGTNNPLSLLDEVRALREDIRQVTGFILELKRDYSVLEDKIELNSSDVLRLLGISKASLARWREAKVIPYRYLSSNHVVYPFKGLYLAIKTGRATFKGFRRLEALQRMNAYKDGIIKGYMGEDTVIFEEL